MSGTQCLPSEPTALYDMGEQNEPTTNTTFYRDEILTIIGLPVVCFARPKSASRPQIIERQE